MNNCVNIPDITLEQMKGMDEIVNHWNKSKTLKSMIGEVGNGGLKYNAQEYLHEMSRHLFRHPFSEDFKWTGAKIRRFKREIDNVKDNYKHGKLGALRRFMYVSEAIANKSPVSRLFYENINMAVNYERNNMDKALYVQESVSAHIQRELIERDIRSRFPTITSIKLKQKTDKLREEIFNAPDKQTEIAALKELEKIVDLNGEGAVFKEFTDLMEMNTKTFTEAKNQGKYSKNLILAAEESRLLLNDMGGVMIKGLEFMKDTIVQVHGGITDQKNMQSYMNRIDAAIGNIKSGINEGGYLPHIVLTSMIKTNYDMNRYVTSKTPIERNNALRDVMENIDSMIPSRAKSRNDLIENIWDKNPMFILQQYSKDAVAFNKINFLQREYWKAMSRFQKDDINPEFIGQMREFVEDQFRISTKGLKERPEWLNNTIRSLMAIETIKSMGLSTTGAIRNGASAIFFLSESGFVGARRAVKDYHGKYQGILGKIEQQEGFTFKTTGAELVAEGLIPAKSSDLQYDPFTNKLTYKHNGLTKTLDATINKAVGASLVFHRITENFTRRWMFRIAFVQAYEALRPSSLSNKQLEKEAKNFALRTVNKWAFEYSPHAKAKGAGGSIPHGKLDPKTGLPTMTSSDYLAASGELAFQFMHWPMSFLNLQSKILKGAKDAALSRQWDAPEIQTALRFAGINLGVAFLSIRSNLDFTNLLENDTVKRISNFVDYMTKDEDELEGKYYGLINDYTGPIVGDLLYAANVFNLYKFPDENWKKMLTGYIDYHEEFEKEPGEREIKTMFGDIPLWEKRRNMWNRINTQLARLTTKTIPALQDGRGMDVIRHELGLYPRKWTKEWRKKLGIDHIKLDKIEKKRLQKMGINVERERTESATKRLKKLAELLKGYN